MAEILNAFVAQASHRDRVRFDPVELPHRYKARPDIEVSALLSACMAYGRVDLFKPKVEALLCAMGPSPAQFVMDLDVGGAKRLLDGFVYRFNVGADVAVLLLGAGRLLREHGSLEVPFAKALAAHGRIHPALSDFIRQLRQVPMARLRRSLGKERGLHHLLPHPLGPGAAKRLNLFLRWMVRGPDGVDFGLWRKVSPAQLVIPLDTHIGRMARNLGLTRRKDLSWRTAEEITCALRALDSQDPVKYDFALCHFGMSGACPLRHRATVCAECPLLPSCRTGRRVLRSAQP